MSSARPLVPAVALLHFLNALATPRNKMRRFSNSWSLVSEAIRLAMFSCKASWMLVGLLAVCTVPPYVELKNRVRPTRVYVLHMALFVGLMVAGWAGVAASTGRSAPPTWATVLLMAAILVRCGTVPAHCWVTDWFEHTSFGIAMLFVTPLAGVYAAVRLVLPIAPDWVLQSIGLASLVTAVYAAGMAVIQRDCRRLFANLFLSHASLVLVGLELHTEMSLTGSLCLWFSVILSLGGFGLTIRAMEARFGRLRSPSIRDSIRIRPPWQFASCSLAWRAWVSRVHSDSSLPNCWSIVRSKSVPTWASPWCRRRHSTELPWSGPTC